MMILTENTPWILPQTVSEPIERALADLANDWYMVFGAEPIYMKKEEVEGECILFSDGIEAPTDRESFSAKVADGKLCLAGADELGMIHAIYTFSEKILGVHPFYFFNDIMPDRKEEISLPEVYDFSHGSPAFKYRGFFINNEDMISGSFPDPMRENLMDLYYFEKYCELILRLHGNMIAPGTCPYPDETVREVVLRRGMYVNDHHVTPLGLNVYRWPEDQDFSYVTNPEYMEKVWAQCVDAQKHRKMFWTISFRGRGDQSFWSIDPNAPVTEADRAAVISRALHKQAELIRAVQPDADIMFNMYDEQAELCKKGLLRIPEGVTRVWPNDGAGVMSDGGSCAKGDGIYFHITACRNRFCEAVSPEQIYTEFNRFKDAGANGCLIMNIGNIRPFPISIGAAMECAYDGSAYRHLTPAEGQKAYIRNYCEGLYGTAAAEVAEIQTDYFGISNLRKPRPDMPPYGYAGECLGMYASDWQADYNQVLTDFRQNIYMHEIARKYIEALKGKRTLGDIFDKTVDDFNAILHEDTAILPTLSRRAHLLEAKIPSRALPLYRSNLLLQIDATQGLNDAMENEGLSMKAYRRGDKAAAISYMRRALEHMNGMLEVLHSAENPKWPVFYKYETLSCYWHTRDLMRCVLSLLEGKGETPIRPFHNFGGHNKRIYYYHYLPEHQGNFPFLKKR
ncbi:MAG: glycosyl hydrolase 115 family protein [Clostridia bacterium]|nr:glycosyl hydrolase 115 family protein [Clostridia bacterium]